MLEALRGASLVLAIVAAGLIAGLFYAFSVSVMPGLARTDDRTLVHTMQQINIAIINPWFFFSFFGAPLLAALAALLHLGGSGRHVLPWIVLGFVFALGTVIITMVFNVPLNNALDAAGRNPDQIADLSAVREQFEADWVRWNIIRTLTSTAALVFLAWAMVQYGRVSAAGT
ncbi:MAG TPA: anthrone oxygenase family protein [Pseudonocardia sp.]|uniref:anthrone oxygenase family protein n=1 Tax=Pseudonocardia sp. TaxID=60912 RepID=UPI002B92722B|nr:anthrone oxygenase family protein [Pseudonocardia sp.]HTF52854.1 anthrone oxygenase family protein [Pseudonocardia sp.]